jgi:hypothetical protein
LHEGCLWFCIFVQLQTMSFFECVIGLVNIKFTNFTHRPNFWGNIDSKSLRLSIEVLDDVWDTWMFSVQQSVDKHRGPSTEALILKLRLKSWELLQMQVEVSSSVQIIKLWFFSMHFYSSQVLCIVWTTNQVLIVILSMWFF